MGRLYRPNLRSAETASVAQRRASSRHRKVADVATFATDLDTPGMIRQKRGKTFTGFARISWRLDDNTALPLGSMSMDNVCESQGQSYLRALAASQQTRLQDVVPTPTYLFVLFQFSLKERVREAWTGASM